MVRYRSFWNRMRSVADLLIKIGHWLFNNLIYETQNVAREQFCESFYAEPIFCRGSWQTVVRKALFSGKKFRSSFRYRKMNRRTSLNNDLANTLDKDETGSWISDKMCFSRVFPREIRIRCHTVIDESC